MGRLLCDSPIELVQYMLGTFAAENSEANDGKAEYILLTGDLIAHKIS